MNQFSWLLPVLCFSAACFALPVRADDEADRLRKLVEKNAASICTVRAVLKIDLGELAAMGGGMGSVPDQTSEVQGVIVDTQGLILIASQPFSDQQVNVGGQEFEIKITPGDIRVIFENDDKEYTGFIAATDEDLGIAFVQVDDLEGRAIKPLAFDVETNVAVGEPVAMVNRMGKGYDFAPYFELGCISGTVKKPRPALLVSGAITGLGLPVFTLSGQVAGVLASIEPAGPATAQGNPLAMPTRPTPFLIPSKVVQGKIAQAKTTATQMLQEKKAGKSAGGK